MANDTELYMCDYIWSVYYFIVCMTLTLHLALKFIVSSQNDLRYLRFGE